jgi:NAD-dependent deacetylase
VDVSIFKTFLEESDNIVFFGGAGVSTESGIPDFRSSGGLYNEKLKNSYSPEEILSHSFFIRHTKEFYDFYRSKMIYKDASPNAAHKGLAELEKAGKLKAVITQNIDGLHQMAGNNNVLELHGSVHRNYCMECGQFYDLDFIIESEDVPHCSKCGGIVKPDVVLYEESLNSQILEDSVNYIMNADIFIIGGTSLSVYPSAGLVNYYKGDKLILINKSKTPYDSKANYTHYGSIGELFLRIFN